MIWGLGNFGGVSLQIDARLCAGHHCGTVRLIIVDKALNALLLGERYAENLGVNIRRVRNWL